MNKKHPFLLIFLALSLSLWGGYSLFKDWKSSEDKEPKEYKNHRVNAQGKGDPKLSTKEYKGFSATIPYALAKKVSILALTAEQLPKLGTDIINLTAEAEGYQLRPLGLKFKTPIGISIQYDEAKIPEGYTEKDILILSFNRKKKTWERHSVEDIDEAGNTLKGKINQSSDFIAGIIKLPESPDTSGFTPTSISGLKAADPLSGVQSIAPPTANPEGSVATSFSIELPKGRAGMQPNISLQYSSDGGHSWVGQGWNLSLPNVAIDTRWGAPRYDSQSETESYILGGEDLLPNAHRAEWEPRESNKVFHPRREGAFSRIIRKGSHPNDYHWEVASKSGIITYYGNNANSVLRTANGNVAHWQISEQRDLRGNKVEYEYTNVEGALYPKAIYYTGHNGEKGKYSVHFITDADLGEALRADVQISARLGVKQVFNRLLRKIEVRYSGQMVRSYELIYEKGAFEKSLLKEIRQYDAEGNLFYANAMDYYDDIRDASGNYKPFGDLEEWSVPRDNLNSPFKEMIGFSGAPTLVGSSISNTKGINYRLGVGTIGTGILHQNTLGGSGSNSWGKTHSKVLLQDVDGDGLADKVFIDDDKKVYYRKNLLGQGNQSFGEAVLLRGISSLGQSKSYTYSYGIDLLTDIGSLGYNRQISKNTTESYFMDFNGDGLVDFASKGRVYYNRLDANGVPTFELSSTGTPAPVMGSNEPLQLDGDTSIDKEELERKNPLHDVVRTWKAPYTGTIEIHHQYHLIQETEPNILQEKEEYRNNDGTPKADGVKLYFQHSGNVLWNQDIAAEDYAVRHRTDSINVIKGEVLYFRVSSKYDGNYDRTNWLTNIDYKEISTDEKDYNGLSLKFYHPLSDALFTTAQPYIFTERVQPSLKGLLKKKITTDKVILKIIRSSVANTMLQQELFKKTFEADEALEFDLSSITLGQFDEMQTLSIIVESPTEINWQNVEAVPIITFTDGQGEQVEEPLGVDFKIYDKIDEYYKPYLVEPQQKGRLRMSLTSLQLQPLQDNEERGEVRITAKQNGKVVARKHYEILGTTLSDITPSDEIILDSIPASPKLFLEVNLSNKNLYPLLKEKDFRVRLQIKDSIKIPEDDPRYPNEKYEIRITEQLHDQYAVFVPFEKPEAETKFGKTFRGWGSFILNGSLAQGSINPHLLEERYGNYEDSEDGRPNVDPDHFDPNDPNHEGMELSNAYFIKTTAQIKQQKWMGVEEEIYLKGQELSPSRLGENDLMQYLDTSLPVLQGGMSRALEMVSESKSNAYAAGVSVGGVGGLGGTASDGNSYVMETMSDFNGDRFPDFVRGGNVQVTNPRGGLSQQIISNIGHFNAAFMSSGGVSTDGSFSHGSVKNALSANSKKSDNQVEVSATTGADDAKKSNASYSLSGNLTSGEDYTEYTYTDINGDGLVDRISQKLFSSEVEYNTGYGFLPKVPLNFRAINRGDSKDFSAGLGFSLYRGSISGGFNYVRSQSNMNTQLLDLTGDGLADRIEYGENDIKIYQNLGDRVSSEAIVIPRNGREIIGQNNSISYGGGGNYSVGFPLLFIRFAIKVGASLGSNTSRVEATFMDINGDGHLDYVISEKENHLKVALNNFRRTHLLKSVTNGAGNFWEVDYEWKAPTYANPNSAWVLKSVKLFDGHTGDGEDYSITQFEYDKPYYDRRERTFYGYEVVKQKAINPQDNSVLRTSVQEFYNQDYFRKSLLKSAYTLGKDGQKLSESIIKYHIANARTGQDIQSSTLNLPETDATSVFIAPSESIERSYESTAYLENKTQKEYDQNGNVVKFIDSGNGNAESQLTAEIEYYESQVPYYGGIAKKLEVRDIKGLVRKREAEINAQTAELIKVKNYFSDTEFAQTDLEYDTYGNLKSVTGAENEQGQRAKLVYTYDAETHSHITRIKDQFGYENQMAYDYRFNIPIKTTDRNGETMSYTLDAKGRIATILAPKEAKAGKDYTIKYEYSPLTPKGGSNGNVGSISQEALTLNYDAEHDRNIETYTYADGLGRVVQVKKTASIFKGKGQQDEEKHIISGKQIYDALGRVVETYYPTTAPISAVGYQEPSTVNQQPSTKTIYDDKDRAIEQVFPDGSKTQMAYGLSQNANGEWQLATRQTDALGRTSIVYTDAKGQKTKVVQPTGIETKFEYSAIGELRIVTDAEGHQTQSEYDLLGRRTKLIHPDAGTTILQYDKASNLIRRQTSQIREEMPDANIVYNYDYNRLQEIKYPKYPDNNVRYHYGKQEEDKARRGRLWLVEDASGGVEYFYGDMGEVEKEIRTIRISPSEVQTYVTEYEYDSWNRIQTMTYPDGERLDFGYNIAGNLTSLKGSSPFGGEGAGKAIYIAQQGYDEFEQKIYRRLGNDTETTYTYEPVMRRLAELKATRPPHPQGGNNGGIPPSGGRGLLFQNNQYTYDLVGNILSVENAINHQPSTITQLGGSSKYAYEYDELNRLIKAKGQFEGTSNKADYELNMQYNRLNGIVQKALQYTLNGQDKGYTLNYEYNNKKHPHAPSSIIPLSPEGGNAAQSGIRGERRYTYDGNGNPVSYDEFKSFRSMLWDEENRLRGINDNGRLHLYTYDHTGERALKSSAESSMAVINGATSAIITHTEDYTAYVSPYFVVNKGKFTKHYFEGSSRVVSKLGEGTFVHKNTGIMAGGIDYIAQSAQMQKARDEYIKGSLTPPGPPTQHGIYASPEWTGEAYPSIDWSEVSQNQEPPEGWPRPPKFNEPGDVPGPPVQFGPPVTNANVKAGYGYINNGVEERNLYYYHPDHLGSSSYITNKDGEIIQHTEYMAFGETFVDEHSVNPRQPYLFNGKELDYETGLYYYGARYYDPKVSLWLNTDPLSGYNPVQETEHYIDGQHNGGVHNPMNLNTYTYTYQNPILYIDPNGKQNHFGYQYIQQQVKSSVNTLKRNVINKYNNTKQTVVQAGRDAQAWVKNNKTELIRGAKVMQKTGDTMTEAGLGIAAIGLAFEGVGAAPGLLYAGAGTAWSSFGSGIEVAVELITQDFSNNATGKAIYNKSVSKVVDKTVDIIIPGPTPSIQGPVEKALKETQQVKKEMVKEVVTKQLEKE